MLNWKNIFFAGLIILSLGCHSGRSIQNITSLTRNEPFNKIGENCVPLTEYYVDYQSNVYIANFHRTTIDKFSKEGKFLLSFGRKGEGPGEFKFLYPFAANSKGELYVSNYLQKQIMVFSKTGSLTKIISTPEPFIKMKFTIADSLILLSKDRNYGEKVYLMRKNGEKVDFMLLRQDYKRSIKDLQNPIPLPVFNLAFTGDEHGNIYVGDSCDYIIYVFSQKGELTKKRKIKWEKEEIKETDYKVHFLKENSGALPGEDLTAIEILKKNVKNLKGQFKYFPAIIDMDYSNGKLYVWTSKTTGNGNFIIDVYNSNFQLLYKRYGYNCLVYTSNVSVYIRGKDVFVPDFDEGIITGRLSCPVKLRNSGGIFRFELNE